MKEDAFKFVRACDRCQRFANYSNGPTTSITSMASPWPFSMWGIDLIGELPKAKGTEAINKIIKHTLKAKLEEKKGDWLDEMLMVLWSYNTTPSSTTGESLFLLMYGYEPIVPVEVGTGSLRRDLFVEKDAEINQRLHLDLLDEARMNSRLKLAAYQQRIARYFNKKVKYVPYKVGYLVLRKFMQNTKIAQHRVLGANWEGP
ncbi:uncharacterized protein LOC141695719 [Apium graveolens]|uniref:uncharacterized protein LOC141695719 n=1 Tax=Apium graveolens TaxID=4045 RepID=UPI003D7B7E7C